MHPDERMDQQKDGRMDGDMREAAEGEKHLTLEKKIAIIYSSLRLQHCHCIQYCVKSDKQTATQSQFICLSALREGGMHGAGGSNFIPTRTGREETP